MPDNPMFDRYTDRARRALVIAQDEARNLGHAHVGSGHLLLGLIGEDGGAAAQVLKSLGVSLEDARRVVARMEDRPAGVSRTGLPLTPRLAKILELAVPHEAFMLGNSYIATEHLLLGLAAGSAPGASPLVAIGVNPDEARAKVLELLRGYEEAGKRPVTPEPAAAAATTLEQEPPTGSVVAIDWGEPHQEVWVSNKSNIGNWYCPDIPMRGDEHPTWYDVKRRAQGRTLTLLAPAPRDVYAAGFDAGVAKVSEAIGGVIDEMRLYANGNYPDSGEAGHAAT